MAAAAGASVSRGTQILCILPSEKLPEDIQRLKIETKGVIGRDVSDTDGTTRLSHVLKRLQENFSGMSIERTTRLAEMAGLVAEKAPGIDHIVLCGHGSSEEISLSSPYLIGEAVTEKGYYDAEEMCSKDLSAYRAMARALNVLDVELVKETGDMLREPLKGKTITLISCSTGEKEEGGIAHAIATCWGAKVVAATRKIREQEVYANPFAKKNPKELPFLFTAPARIFLPDGSSEKTTLMNVDDIPLFEYVLSKGFMSKEFIISVINEISKHSSRSDPEKHMSHVKRALLLMRRAKNMDEFKLLAVKLFVSALLVHEIKPTELCKVLGLDLDKKFYYQQLDLLPVDIQKQIVQQLFKQGDYAYELPRFHTLVKPSVLINTQDVHYEEVSRALFKMADTNEEVRKELDRVGGLHGFNWNITKETRDLHLMMLFAHRAMDSRFQRSIDDERTKKSAELVS